MTGYFPTLECALSGAPVRGYCFRPVHSEVIFTCTATDRASTLPDSLNPHHKLLTSSRCSNIQNNILYILWHWISQAKAGFFLLLFVFEVENAKAFTMIQMAHIVQTENSMLMPFVDA